MLPELQFNYKASLSKSFHAGNTIMCVYSQSGGVKNMVPADKAGICLTKQEHKETQDE